MIVKRLRPGWGLKMPLEETRDENNIKSGLIICGVAYINI